MKTLKSTQIGDLKALAKWDPGTKEGYIVLSPGGDSDLVVVAKSRTEGKLQRMFSKLEHALRQMDKLGEVVFRFW